MKKYIHIVAVTVITGILLLWMFTSYGVSGEGKAETVVPHRQQDFGTINTSALEKEGEIFASWLRGNLNRQVVPSAVAGIVKGGRLVFSSGVYADNNTSFGIASLSKTFTAILALRLVEEGKLNLDDKVSHYLPGLKIARGEINSQPVTVRHLLAHTSGIPTFGRNYRNYQFKDESVSLPEQTNPAGYCYAYSNPGFVLIKFIIESATGKSYEENLKQYLLDPLEMYNSTGIWSNGTGGIRTTLNDLVKYTSMLIGRGKLRGKSIISEALFDEMLAPPMERPETGVDYHYSLSWEVITVGGHIDSYYKAGRWYGEASAVQVFPRYGIALIYLCNPPQHLTKSFMAWRGSLTGRLRNLVRIAEGNPGICRDWPSLTPRELKRYTGTYRNVRTGKEFDVFFRSNSLYSNIYGPPQKLRVYSSNRLLLGKSQKLHNFVWRDNRVIGLSLTGGFYELAQ